MITSPRDALYQKLIPLGIGDVATLAASWSALGLEATGSGLTFAIVGTAEIAGAGTVLAALALPGALIGGAMVFGALIAAPFITENEGLLHDITESISAVHPFLSPATQALVAVSAPFMSVLPTNNYGDPFALQKLGGAIGDLATGGLSGSVEERFLSVVGSAAGAPGWLEDEENLRNYLSPSPSPTPSSSPGVSPGTPSPVAPGIGGGMSAGEGLYPFSPGLGDSGSYYPDADGSSSDSGYSSFNGDGFTMTMTVGGSGPETPGAPAPGDPPALPDPPAPSDPPSPPASPSPPSPPSPPPPPADDDDDDDDDDE